MVTHWPSLGPWGIGDSRSLSQPHLAPNHATSVGVAVGGTRLGPSEGSQQPRHSPSFSPLAALTRPGGPSQPPAEALAGPAPSPPGARAFRPLSSCPPGQAGSPWADGSPVPLWVPCLPPSGALLPPPSVSWGSRDCLGPTPGLHVVGGTWLCPAEKVPSSLMLQGATPAPPRAMMGQRTLSQGLFLIVSGSEVSRWMAPQNQGWPAQGWVCWAPGGGPAPLPGP